MGDFFDIIDINQLLFHIEMFLPQAWNKRFSIGAQIVLRKTIQNLFSLVIN